MEKRFLLSNLVQSISPDIEVFFVKEKPFEVLSLAVQKTNRAACVFVDRVGFADKLGKNVSMVLTRPELKEEFDGHDTGICLTPDPRKLFFELQNYLSSTSQLIRDHFVTTIDESAMIHPLSSIDINNVKIGKNVVIEEFVVIRANTTIGNNSIIRAGSIIGGNGFEFKRNGTVIDSVHHVGGVVIGENVEIQYNSCVDRAVYVWDDTTIGDFSKLDNQVYIAHAAKIGKRALITANCVVGGRVEIGDDCWLGFSATIRNGIEIGRDARVNMGAVVTKDIPDGGSVTGNFAIDHQVFIEDLREKNKRK